jgi:hypothetical protein
MPLTPSSAASSVAGRARRRSRLHRSKFARERDRLQTERVSERLQTERVSEQMERDGKGSLVRSLGEKVKKTLQKL